MHCSLLNEKRPQGHVVLVYDNKKKVQEVIVDFLNTGLENGQLCVYAYVNLEPSFFAKLNDKINDFDRCISNDDLLLVGLKPYKTAIIGSHYDVFENFKDYLMHKATQRNDKFIRFIGDLATDLFYEEKYDHWKSLEELWQNKPFEGCYVCPYDSTIIERDQQRKELLFSLHDDIVFADDFC